MDRREALKRMGVLAAAAGGLGCAGEGAGDGEAMTAAGGSPSVGGSPSTGGTDGPIGVQLYTVRSEMEKDVEAALERVAGLGYREVEFAGYFGHTPGEIRAMVEAAGLTAPATHIPATADDDVWKAQVDMAAEAGHRFIVVPWLPAEARATLDDWRGWAEWMNRAGEMARAGGLQYAYHNHDFEFVEVEGRIPFDVLFDETDPGLVQIELDCFWATHAGHDPVEIMGRFPGRIPLVHVKDRTTDGTMVAVGAGAIDWPGIFAHGETAGLVHRFVEHDNPGDDPFASIAASYRYLSGLTV